jgi:[acyl-carrier-protein] S-malonyltransferase
MLPTTETIGEVCRTVAEGQVVGPANFNSPNQTVIAGHREAVERAVEALKRSGAKRALMLDVSAPFHSALMKPAEDRLAHDLDRLEFSDLRVPIVTNVDAKVVTSGEEARDALKRQPSRPVKWAETVRLLLDSGVDTFVEIGPGKVLLGLVRSIEKSATMLNVEDDRSLEAVRTVLR